MDPCAVNFTAVDYVQAFSGILAYQLPGSFFRFFRGPQLIVFPSEEELFHYAAVIGMGFAGKGLAAFSVYDKISATGYNCVCLFDCHTKTLLYIACFSISIMQRLQSCSPYNTEQGVWYDCSIPPIVCQGEKTAWELDFLAKPSFFAGISIHNIQNQITKSVGIRGF